MRGDVTDKATVSVENIGIGTPRTMRARKTLSGWIKAAASTTSRRVTIRRARLSQHRRSIIDRRG